MKHFVQMEKVWIIKVHIVEKGRENDFISLFEFYKMQLFLTEQFRRTSS